MRYEEGVFIGYRHYDRMGIAPLFPFGFGLGYTNFALADLTLDDSRFEADGTVEVSFTIANTGKRAGGTVAQVYVSDDLSSAPRPAKELKGFEKVFLGPGESRRVSVTLDDRAFAFFRPDAKHWLVEPGKFTIAVGFSSAELSLQGKVQRQNALMLPV